MSKIKIANVRDGKGNKLVEVDYGWTSKLLGQHMVNWHIEDKKIDNGLSGKIVNNNPVFIVDKNFKELVLNNIDLCNVESFDIVGNVEERNAINIVDLQHEISQYEYEFGITIPKKKLKEIIKKLQYKEVIK